MVSTVKSMSASATSSKRFNSESSAFSSGVKARCNKRFYISAYACAVLFDEGLLRKLGA